MPYFRETSMSFFWVCGYKKLSKFNEGDVVLLMSCTAALSCFRHVLIWLICGFVNRSSNKTINLLAHHQCWLARGLFARIWPPSFVQGGWMCRPSVSSMVEIECRCPFVALCWSCSVIWKLLWLIFAKTFRGSTELRGFLCAYSFADAPTNLWQSRCAGSLAPGSIKH
jgi:hypothetical protein